MVPLLEAKQIEYQYGTNDFLTLGDVSLTLQPGEVVAITGHSGSGKSTLLHLLSGMIPLQKGELFWEGQGLPGNPKDAQSFLFSRVGMVFQAFHVVPYLNVEENLAMGSMFYGQDLSRMDHLLQKTGLEAFRKKKVSELSGGQKQRVAIGRAMMKGAKLLLADEPTGNLDERTGAEILDLFHTLAKDEGCGVCFVTHELSGISSADVVYHLQEGILKKSE